MNMQLKNIVCAAGLALLMAGCKNNVDFKKTKGGMPYKLFTKGGPKLKEGNILKLYFKVSINDSVLQTNYGQEPAYIPVSSNSRPYDISEVLPLLHKGDSLYAVQLVDTFMKQSPQGLPPFMKKGDKLITTLKVVDVFTSETAANQDREKEKDQAFNNNTSIQEQLKKDNQILSDYMTKNNIQGQKTKSGAYVQIIAEGSGPKVEEGKFVSLMYKGYTLGGKVFDTNMDNSFKHTEPLSFVVGQSPMLKGFTEGVMMLKKGDKARILIPSALAYGAQSPTPDIGANENLIFDVIVSDVKDQPAAGAQGDQPQQ